MTIEMETLKQAMVDAGPRCAAAAVLLAMLRKLVSEKNTLTTEMGGKVWVVATNADIGALIGPTARQVSYGLQRLKAAGLVEILFTHSDKARGIKRFVRPTE